MSDSWLDLLSGSKKTGIRMDECKVVMKINGRTVSETELVAMGILPTPQAIKPPVASSGESKNPTENTGE
jgi:hypothetical protein